MVVNVLDKFHVQDINILVGKVVDVNAKKNVALMVKYLTQLSVHVKNV